MLRCCPTCSRQLFLAAQQNLGAPHWSITVLNPCHSLYCLQVVAKAKVPIIKFIEHESNVNFDISFDVPNGPIAAGFVRDLMDTLPPMKPLVLVLKIFLQQRGFNEVTQPDRQPDT